MNAMTGSAAATPTWLPLACARLQAVRRSHAAEPAFAVLVERAWSALLARHAAPDLLSFVSADAATPFVPLLEALRKDLGLREDDPRLVDVAEGTLLAYLEVRAQDDLVDEPDAWERAFVYLVGELSSASVAAFARAAGARAGHFFAFRADVLRAFAHVAVREVAQQATGVPLERERLGDKFLPLAVCLGALAAAADRVDLLPGLVRIVSAAGTGLQLVNDLLNVAEDQRAGRTTLAVASLPKGTGDGARLALLAGDCNATLDEARRALASAEGLAARRGLRAVAAVIARRLAFVDSVPARLLALHLGGAIS